MIDDFLASIILARGNPHAFEMLCLALVLFTAGFPFAAKAKNGQVQPVMVFLWGLGVCTVLAVPYILISELASIWVAVPVCVLLWLGVIMMNAPTSPVKNGRIDPTDEPLKPQGRTNGAFRMEEDSTRRPNPPI